MAKFIFEKFNFDQASMIASFSYRFDNGMKFEEKVIFESSINYNRELLDRVMFLSFVIVGISYYKLFPTSEVIFETGNIDDWQAVFFNKVYQEGLGQFAYENNLTRDNLAKFLPTNNIELEPIAYNEKGILSLQSGGKDSLLTATLLKINQNSFTPWYVQYSSSYPKFLDDFDEPLLMAKRIIDKQALALGQKNAGLNGHVPVTYIIASFALIQAVLTGCNQILLSIGHEGEEPHGWIGDLAVNHQWAKTFEAEQLLADYISRYVSSDISIGSPLRCYSELKIAELFVNNAWHEYGNKFSSCNLANYMQGSDNSQLKWCGKCPKCLNSYLLFAAFLPAVELQSIFNDKDLFAEVELQDMFKGLLGLGNFMKPFECIAEIYELRLAYHKSQLKLGYAKLPFDVPLSKFDYSTQYPSQNKLTKLLDLKKN